MTVDTIQTGLHDGSLRQLAGEIMGPVTGQPFGAYLFAGDEPGAELGRQLEYSVFLEAFGNTPDQLAREFGPYEQSTLFIIVLDHLRRLPAGVMRVVLPSPAGSKSLNDLALVWGEPAKTVFERTGLTLDPARTWDIATLAIAREYRGKAAAGLVSMGLYQTLSLAARGCGAEWFVAILDLPVFRLIRWKLRLIFAGFKGITALPYLGSAASIPAWCDVVAAERRLEATDPYLYEILVVGRGLEPAVRPLDLSRCSCLTARPREAAAGR
jgi:hypothetical protein